MGTAEIERPARVSMAPPSSRRHARQRLGLAARHHEAAAVRHDIERSVCAAVPTNPVQACERGRGFSSAFHNYECGTELTTVNVPVPQPATVAASIDLKHAEPHQISRVGADEVATRTYAVCPEHDQAICPSHATIHVEGFVPANPIVVRLSSRVGQKHKRNMPTSAADGLTLPRMIVSRMSSRAMQA